MNKNSTQGKKGQGLLIINAGLFRSGSKSMARAYQILGFKTHHGLLEKVTETPWVQLEAAAEATWPSTANPSRQPFTRTDWDALWGTKYDAATDLASPFALQLIEAYPEAKVVIIQRDFEAWWPSFKTEVLDRVMLQPAAAINGFLGLYLMGMPAVQAMRKIHFGFFGARCRDDILVNAKERYSKYYDDLRVKVPVKQRLEFCLEDGWEPLCEFLGVDVPDEPFPRENEAGAHNEEAKARTRLIWSSGFKILGPVVLGLVAGGAAFALNRRR
ncbi:uncharacterized protein N7484_007193 [Penicillium longicatenatum]|uniref:uncharacterized protein n=1 Tax=Penicillium longicatenatum TaxID=1561947 RepID=UPI0025493D82|nr:uncharacterized protein N7484_007193 [Penicillium longicatenatum]KAJ5639331.1 hypothetical protein N7484_007193 [Penicillium longicatenatum]